MSLNIVNNSQFDLTPGGLDDGVYTAGVQITNVLCDTASINQSNETVDHRAGKEPTQFMRKVARDFEARFDTTLLAAAVMPDVTFTFYPGGADDRVYNAGSGLTSTKVNSLQLVETNNLINAKPRQSPMAFYRGDNKGGSVTIDFNLHPTAGTSQLEGLAAANDLMGFLITILIGASSRTITASGHGLVRSLDVMHGEPNRGRIVIDAGYGQSNGTPAGAPGSPFQFTDTASSPLKAVLENDIIRMALAQNVAGAQDFDVTGIREETSFIFDRSLKFAFSLRPYGIEPTIGYS